MTNDERIAAIRETAIEVDGSVYENYSGRSMFGRSCYGIVCGDKTACIEAAARRGLVGAKTDAMGHDFIVYWPHVTLTQDSPDTDEGRQCSDCGAKDGAHYGTCREAR